MKRYLLALALLIIAISGCKKDDDFDAAKQAAQDEADIQAYIKANALTDVVKDVSGLYYKVITPGTGAYPTATSTVTVNYAGTLLNGTPFDSNNGFKTSLNAVVRGWTVGLQHINTGGRILLLIPSAMGYGNNDKEGIPKNSVLLFKVDLLSIN